MLEISATDRWHKTFPGGCIGALEVSGVVNAPRETPLDARKREIEAELREKYKGFSRADICALELMQAYEQYYKCFGKTYHLQLQLESVVLKGKSLPSVTPLVDSNFMAELQTLVLTAGHDVSTFEGPLRIDASDGTEELIQFNGSSKIIKPHDMIMADGKGVVCTIIYGQDKRTPISESTNRALYVAYAPCGVPVESVQQQLDLITDNIKQFAPAALVENCTLFIAGR